MAEMKTFVKWVIKNQYIMLSKETVCIPSRYCHIKGGITGTSTDATVQQSTNASKAHIF